MPGGSPLAQYYEELNFETVGGPRQMQKYKLVLAGVAASVLSLLLGASASAHVMVLPKEVQTATTQTFTVTVPSERDASTVEIDVQMPDGLSDVMPTVQAGWTANNVTASGVTLLQWSGGSIPTGQRAEFSFSAHVPAKIGTLDWKAFQTYDDGTHVAWDQKPSATEKDDDSATSGPFAVTNIVAQSAEDAQIAKAQAAAADAKKGATHATAFGIIGIAVGLVALASAPKRQGGKADK
jgi:uncharacterized protein YcnI